MIARRQGNRFWAQPDAPDLLPDIDCDLRKMIRHKLPRTPATVAVPGDRLDMHLHLNRLQQQFAGQSELLLYHALAMSYLRRDTPHTAKAHALFRRFWAEAPWHLRKRLSTRWLISTLQTFYDHSPDPGERIAGAVGFMYGNLIKVYETEFHAITAGYEVVHESFENRSVPDMHGFEPGDDILFHINVLAYDAATQGGLARPALVELLRRVKRGDTLFHRIDRLHDHPDHAGHPHFTSAFEGRVKGRDGALKEGEEHNLSGGEDG